MITSEAALVALRDDWEKLQRCCSAPNVFTTWGWIWSWWCVFGKTERATRLFIVIARKEGELAGILPLVSRSTRLCNRLRKLEFPDLTFADYMDPLIAGDAEGILAAMFAFLAGRTKEWDLLLLRRVSDNGDLPYVIGRALRVSGLRSRQRTDEAYLWMEISSRADGQRSARSRNTQQRKLRRMHEAGLTCRVIEHPEVEPMLLDRMAAVERKRIVAGRAAGLLLACHTEFFRSIFDTLGDAGWLYVGVVEQANMIVAYEFGFRQGRKLLAYTKGYDAAFASCSPGKLLTSAVIEYGQERGHVEYDMLRGQEPFKKQMTQCVHQTVRFSGWNRSFRSRLAARAYYGIRVFLIAVWSRVVGRPIHPDL